MIVSSWSPLGIFQLRTPPCDSVHGHFLLLLIVSFLQLTSVDSALLLETHWPARPQFPTAVASCDFRVEGESSRLSQQGAARCDASRPRRSAISFNIHQTEPVSSGRGLFLETWQPNKHRLRINLLFPFQTQEDKIQSFASRVIERWRRRPGDDPASGCRLSPPAANLGNVTCNICRRSSLRPTLSTERASPPLRLFPPVESELAAGRSQGGRVTSERRRRRFKSLIAFL